MRKKWFAAAAVLLLIGAGGWNVECKAAEMESGPSLSSGFSEVFEEGNLVLQEKEVPAAMEGMTAVSVSPDGTKMFGYRTEESGNEILCIADMENGTVTDVWIDGENGVEDVYGTFAREEEYYQKYAYELGTPGAVVWSPDSSCLSPVPTLDAWAKRANFSFDLTLIDAESGAWIDLETTENRLVGGEVGLPVSVCFDSTGENLYYIEYGTRYETRTVLKTCNLETRKISVLSEICYPGDENGNPLEQLLYLEPNRLAAIGIGMQGDVYWMYMDGQDGTWETTFIPCGNYRDMSERNGEGPLIAPDMFDVGVDGRGLVLWENSYDPRTGSYLSLTDLTTSMDISESMLTFPSDGLQTMRKESLEELKNSGADSNRSVCCVTLSPDNRYALLAIRNMGTSSSEAYQLNVLNLETLEYKAVSTDEAFQSRNLGRIFNLGRQPVFDWGEANQILISDEEGAVHVLEFVLGGNASEENVSEGTLNRLNLRKEGKK